MIRRASALLGCMPVVVMTMAEPATAGVWYTDPVVGVQSDYSTNPGLLGGNHNATTDAAILFDAPTTFSANGWSLLFDPTIRYSDNSGYTSLISNYEHFTAAAEIDSEVDSVKLTAIAERDSSLFQDYSFNGSVGVRQDTALADLTWVRALTERLNFNLESDYTRVQYGLSNGFETLTDYTYSSMSPSLAWKSSERTTLSLLTAFSLYNSLDGNTRSSDANVELGVARQLNEIWTLSGKAGVSRESDEIKEYFGPFLLGSFKSSQKGTVFSVDLTRAGLRLNAILTASRSLVPSGFAFLSRRDLYEIQATYQQTARWSYSAYARYRDEKDPQFFVPTLEIKYYDAGVSAQWLMSEFWTLTLNASHVSEEYGTPGVHVGENALSIQLSRRFNRINWH